MNNCHALVRGVWGRFITRGNLVREADQRHGPKFCARHASGMIQEVTIINISEVPEVLLLNNDAGFVRKGMNAAIKLEAYPFTRYDTTRTVVEWVSPDATVDQQRGLVFPVRLRLISNQLLVDGRTARLSPGMMASAEIVTGTRRVINYLWSPVARSFGEAERER